MYSFKKILIELDTFLNRTIVRYEEKEQDIFEYGVEFQISESDRDDLALLLNKITLLMKQNPLFNNGTFIVLNPLEFLTKLQNS